LLIVFPTFFILIFIHNCLTKKIKLALLENALKVLLKHKPKNLASSGPGDPPDRDEFIDRKPRLKEFMEKCIVWCKKNNKEEILIYFG